MSAPPESTEVSRFATLLAGLVLGAFSMAITALVLLAGFRAAQFHQASWGGALLVLVLAALALGLGRISWRLVANRPNEYDSLFGPLGWKLCSVICAVAAVFVGYLAVHERDASAAGGVGGALVMAVGSWRRGVAISRSIGKVPSDDSVERSCAR